MNKYEITIRKIAKGQKVEKRIINVESEMGIDWMAKAVKQVGG